MNSRCALWSRLDQRASLPPLCVGLRVSRRGAPPGISSGFAQFTPKKGPKIGHFWGFPRPPTRLNTLRRVKPSGLKPANLYSTKWRPLPPFSRAPGMGHPGTPQWWHSTTIPLRARPRPLARPNDACVAISLLYNFYRSPSSPRT